MKKQRLKIQDKYTRSVLMPIIALFAVIAFQSVHAFTLIPGDPRATISLSISGTVSVPVPVVPTCDINKIDQTLTIPDVDYDKIPNQSTLASVDALPYMTVAQPSVPLLSLLSSLNKYKNQYIQSQDITINCDYKGTTPTKPLRLTFSNLSSPLKDNQDLSLNFSGVSNWNNIFDEYYYKDTFFLATFMVVNSSSVYRLDFKNFNTNGRTLESVLPSITTGQTTLRFYFLLTSTDLSSYPNGGPKTFPAAFNTELPITLEFY